MVDPRRDGWLVARRRVLGLKLTAGVEAVEDLCVNSIAALIGAVFAAGAGSDRR
jgi:hypothetical protein